MPTIQRIKIDGTEYYLGTRVSSFPYICVKTDQENPHIPPTHPAPLPDYLGPYSVRYDGPSPPNGCIYVDGSLATGVLLPGDKKVFTNDQGLIDLHDKVINSITFNGITYAPNDSCVDFNFGNAATQVCLAQHASQASYGGIIGLSGYVVQSVETVGALQSDNTRPTIQNGTVVLPFNNGLYNLSPQQFITNNDIVTVSGLLARQQYYIKTIYLSGTMYTIDPVSPGIVCLPCVTSVNGHLPQPNTGDVSFPVITSVRTAAATYYPEFNGVLAMDDPSYYNGPSKLLQLDTTGKVPQELLPQQQSESGTHLTETWHSDDYTSWYRRYSDDWVEQGGVFRWPGGPKSSMGGGGSNNWGAINFPVVFASAENYTAVASPVGLGGAMSPTGCCFVSDCTATSMRVATKVNSSAPAITNDYGFNWYACGYAQSSQ